MSVARNFQKLFSFATKSSSFSRVVKEMRIIHAESGKVHCELDVKEEHLNVNNSLHGGMTCVLVDEVSSFAIGTSGEHKFGASVDLNVSFLSTAVVGDTLTIKSEVKRIGKTLAFATVDISKQDGKLIALGRQTKFL